MQSVNRSKFIPELESLRGIAATIVVLGHSYILTGGLALTASSDSVFYKYVLFGLIDPQPAVIMFFVLSGFVLSRQLSASERASPSVLSAYFIRRIFRLIPAMWFSIAFALTLYCALWLPTGLRDGRLPSPLTIEFIANTLLTNDLRVNVVIWTMRVEIIASAIFPLLFFACRRISVRSNIIVSAALLSLSYLPGVPDPLRYLVCFHVGALSERLSMSTIFKHWGIIIAFSAVVVNWAPLIVGGPFRNWTSLFPWMWLTTFASAALIVGVAHGRDTAISSFLRLPVARFLGRISYSLYLLHLPILLVVVSSPGFSEFKASWPLMCIVVVAVAVMALSIACANLCYLFVEQPFVALGRRLAARFAAKPLVAAQ